MAVTPEGKIITYQEPHSPISCVDNSGTDALGKVRLIDGNVSQPSTYFDGYPGDYLILDFGQLTSSSAKLIMRDDKKCANPGMDPPCCIEVQILYDNQWLTVSVVAPRECWATEAVDLGAYATVGQELMIRLHWTLPHRLDYVGLDTTSNGSVQLRSALPIAATHSVQGSVLAMLLRNDGTYAELTPGQQIQLIFVMPNTQNQDQERTFVFYTEGHYSLVT